MARVAIISHRGGSFLWPENSLVAFRETLRLPVEEAECDVHLSADGTVMVLHDATLDRTTDGTGPLGALALDALGRVRVKGTAGEAVPTLAGLATLFRDTAMRLRVEVKMDGAGRPYPGIVAKTLAELNAAGIRHRSVLIGFQAPQMAEALAAGGLAGVSWLLEGRALQDVGVDGIVAAARSYGFRDLGFPARSLDAALLARLRAAGFAVNVWGANHAGEIARMLELGVDAFATDDPPLALAMRG
ncbi:MAG TPA: glycerophosphodiester phosphodiesterase family protein [Roseomonas sp.]|jgi:glycerophosphoryl diester phosphodiesterase